MPSSSQFASYRRGSIMGQRMGMLSISPDTFEAIENYIRWCELVPKRLPGAMNHLVRMMALVHVGYAQKYAAGPVDPQQHRPELAWKLPVRRISGRYFFGWQAHRITLGHWVSINLSPEAYFIEYGIHRNPRTGTVSPRRIRRPINKLALIRTMRFMQQTSVAHRIWSSVYVPPSSFRTKGLFWNVQSPGVGQERRTEVYRQTSGEVGIVP